jgi:hypothetical protein
VNEIENLVFGGGGAKGVAYGGVVEVKQSSVLQLELHFLIRSTMIATQLCITIVGVSIVCVSVLVLSVNVEWIRI